MIIYICSVCGGSEHYRDRVKRCIKTKGGVVKSVYVERYCCDICGRVERKLPKNILPYKHYERDIFDGVINGWITSNTLGYEDYPCEMTMVRWRHALIT